VNIWKIILPLCLVLSSVAVADEPVVPGPPGPVASANPVSSSQRKSKVTREKETEGTEAADRFEADTVIKSKYHLDGQQLEVDPD